MRAPTIGAVLIVGAGIGYVLAGLTWARILQVPYVVVLLYMCSMMFGWIPVIRLYRQFAKANPESSVHSRPLEYAPHWSRLLACSSFGIPAAIAIWMGGTTEVAFSDPRDAAPWEVAVFFMYLAAFWLFAMPWLLSIHRRSLLAMR